MQHSTLPADDSIEEHHDRTDEVQDFPVPDILDSPVDDEEGIERGEQDDGSVAASFAAQFLAADDGQSGNAQPPEAPQDPPVPVHTDGRSAEGHRCGLFGHFSSVRFAA